jgi:hypothetical protein
MTSSRRTFIKDVSIAAAGLTLARPGYLLTGKADRKVRLAFIGTGLRWR